MDQTKFEEFEIKAFIEFPFAMIEEDELEQCAAGSEYHAMKISTEIKEEIYEKILEMRETQAKTLKIESFTNYLVPMGFIDFMRSS